MKYEFHPDAHPTFSTLDQLHERGGKFRLYRHTPMLIDYLLVSFTSIALSLSKHSAIK